MPSSAHVLYNDRHDRLLYMITQYSARHHPVDVSWQEHYDADEAVVCKAIRDLKSRIRPCSRRNEVHSSGSPKRCGEFAPDQRRKGSAAGIIVHQMRHPRADEPISAVLPGPSAVLGSAGA